MVRGGGEQTLFFVAQNNNTHTQTHARGPHLATTAAADADAYRRQARLQALLLLSLRHICLVSGVLSETPTWCVSPFAAVRRSRRRRADLEFDPRVWVVPWSVGIEIVLIYASDLSFACSQNDQKALLTTGHRFLFAHTATGVSHQKIRSADSGIAARPAANRLHSKLSYTYTY